MKKGTAVLILAAVVLTAYGCTVRPVPDPETPEPSASPVVSAQETPVTTPGPTSTPAPSPTPVVTFTPDPTATPSPTPEPTQEPTPEPTPEPEGQKARRSGKLVVPGDWGVEIPLRAVPADDSFFDTSCMIGNSMVQGFQLWAGLHNIPCMAETGATVYSALKLIDLRPLRNNRYDNVYIMLGLNEVGLEPETFTENYSLIVDYVRAYQPSANIIVISVTPVMRWVDEQPYSTHTMVNINALNTALRSMCGQKECWYLDISSVLEDEDGFLSEVYAYMGDGKHMEANGYELWADYMRSHYVDEALLTE